MLPSSSSKAPLAPKPTNLPQLLATVATKSTTSKSPERRAAIENAATDLMRLLPSLGNKLFQTVTSSRRRHATLDAPFRAPTALANLQPCYIWLLSNLNNPYPAREERDALCKKCGRNAKEITAWFVTARQRIGWSRLRATRFNRSQVTMVAAASRFWCERDTYQPLPPDIELQFAEIEYNAQTLYSEAYNPDPALIRLIKRANQTSQKSQPATVNANESSARKRSSDEGGLTHAGRNAKRRFVSFDITTPPTGPMSHRRGSAPSAITPSRSMKIPANISFPHPKFGEASLQPSPSKNLLKRSLSVDDEPPEPKRRRMLPEWHDPRVERPSGHRMISITHPRGVKPSRRLQKGRATSATTSGARLDHDRRALSETPAVPTTMSDMRVLYDTAATSTQSSTIPADNILDSIFDPYHAALVPAEDQSPCTSFVPLLLDGTTSSPTSSSFFSPPGSAPLTPSNMSSHLADVGLHVGTAGDDQWPGVFDDMMLDHDAFSEFMPVAYHDTDLFDSLVEKPLPNDVYADALFEGSEWVPLNAETSHGSASVPRTGKLCLPNDGESCDWYLNDVAMGRCRTRIA